MTPINTNNNIDQLNFSEIGLKFLISKNSRLYTFTLHTYFWTLHNRFAGKDTYIYFLKGADREKNAAQVAWQPHENVIKWLIARDLLRNSARIFNM